MKTKSRFLTLDIYSKIVKAIFIITFFVTLIMPKSLWSQSIEYTIHQNGSFDIKGSSINLTGCYPAIDNRSIKPLEVKVSKSKNTSHVLYNLGKYSLLLSFGYNENALQINTEIIGNKVSAITVSPIHQAIVDGVNQVYQTPKRIDGKGGLKEWPSEKLEYYKSYTITGLVPKNGTTLVISSRDNSKYTSYCELTPTGYYDETRMIDVRVNTELIPTNAIQSIFITENVNVYDAMRNEAMEVAKVAGVKINKPQSYHWCSWYYAYYYLTEDMLLDYVSGFKAIQPEVTLQTIQIDASYFPHVGDWLEPDPRFPNGIENAVKEIIANNYRAGIWIGPYMVGNRSKLYQEHPDWILHDIHGNPIIKRKMYEENRLWGAQDEEVYVLDVSHPEAMKYLRMVFRTFKEMGITFYKTDFMVYGNEPSHKVKRHTPGKTSVEYQHDLFEIIREEIGEESYWLGCIAPFTPMIGYVDGMRISGDIGAEWKYSKNMFKETIGCQFFNNVWWQNDPDAIILRKDFNHMSDVESRSLILWMGMLGGVINTSAPLHDIPEDRVELFRFLKPSETPLTSTLPFLESDSKIQVQLKEYPSENAWAILFLNLSENKMIEEYDLRELVGINKVNCYEWNEKGSVHIGLKEKLIIKLEGHESKLIYLSEKGTPPIINLGGKKIK